MKIQIKGHRKLDKNRPEESPLLGQQSKPPVKLLINKKKVVNLNQEISTWLIFVVAVGLISLVSIGRNYLFSKKEPVKAHDEINQNDSSVGFFELLGREKYVAFYLSVSDEASVNLTLETRNRLREMGSVRIQELGYRGSYVGVIENQHFVAEDLNNQGAASVKFGRVFLQSSGYSVGNKSQILFNGHNLSLGYRGINVVAQTRDGFLEQYCYDFYESTQPKSKKFMTVPMPTNFYSVQIILGDKEYEILRKKRDEALKIGILLTSDEDFVPAKIQYRDTILAAKIRLKGDWVDHLKGKKWSYRIELEKDSKLFGMSKFSIHHPATRNYLGEWVFHKALKREGILGLRYSFINTELRIQGKKYDSLFDLGTYAMEESFDKFLIENNRRREGVIVKINEDLMWEGTAQARRAGLAANLSEYQLSGYTNMPILPFSQREVLADPNFSKQFRIARTLFYDFLNEKLPASDVFDVEKLAKYNAISCLLGATHGLELHNQRLYYNPIIGKLEPIGFYGNAGEPITDVTFYALTSKDVAYKKAFAAALEQVSKKEYLDELFSSLEGMDKNFELLKMEFEGVIFDKTVLYQNQKVIDKALHPTASFHAFLTDVNHTKLTLTLRSISPFPTEILNVNYRGGRVLAKTKQPYVLDGKSEQTIEFDLPEYYQNLFVDKKSGKVLFSKSRDLENFTILYRTLGASQSGSQRILPWEEKADDSEIKDLIILKKSNVERFSFLVVDEEKKTITIKPGQRTVEHDMIIPRGYTVIGNEGVSVDLIKGSSIVSYSPLFFKGSKERPVTIFSSDSTGRGVVVLSGNVKSEITHTNFINLRNPLIGGITMTGAVNFYESPVDLKYIRVIANKCEDAINIVRSKFSIYEAAFLNTASDAFDGDFVDGTITNAHFENLGNDAIDISGSNVSVRNITIVRAGDKGLSAGEKSNLTGRRINISASEIGVASKDKSVIQLDSVSMVKCNLGFTAFQKKNEYGPAIIEADHASSDCRTPFLIESRSALTLNGVRVATSFEVMNRLYGNEFGKKSD
jgi:hypothetical protein